ncbi:DNA polymerase beta superfamily protein [Deinococcus actinosclerus]|uniref:Nucleotidyltransferase n=1 Tax=Deinococcus actinosclerus TaxID=1768108 RepID=A0ABM5X926_9DEIO|nr:nucleotidyltransferase domain-containing protein [Deinococcus actinosclerus]ALW90169.1 nucleotidyltransferase [Deinococcus actinosclerus]
MDAGLSFPPQLTQYVRGHAFPLVFATVSGAHLYGFPSADSDWDLRGVHVLPLAQVLGLREGPGTWSLERDDGVVELDLVTHDAHKFAGLLLKRNGYVLEQLLSPLVVHSSAAHAALVALAPGVLTRHHAGHYLGFTVNQWRLLEKEAATPQGPRVKPLLYAFRTVLTGLHLLRTGQMEANLGVLNTGARLPFLEDLMALKRSGREAEPLPEPLEVYRAAHRQLLAALEAAPLSTRLPDAVPDAAQRAVSDWVVQVRLGALPLTAR